MASTTRYSTTVTIYPDGGHEQRLRIPTSKPRVWGKGGTCRCAPQ
jgi:hypothetical protein